MAVTVVDSTLSSVGGRTKANGVAAARKIVKVPKGTRKTAGQGAVVAFKPIYKCGESFIFHRPVDIGSSFDGAPNLGKKRAGEFVVQHW